MLMTSLLFFFLGAPAQAQADPALLPRLPPPADQEIDPWQPHVLTNTFGFGSGYYNLSWQARRRGMVEASQRTGGTGMLFSATQGISAPLIAYGVTGTTGCAAGMGKSQSECAMMTTVAAGSITLYVLSRLVERVTIHGARARLEEERKWQRVTK